MFYKQYKNNIIQAMQKKFFISNAKKYFTNNAKIIFYSQCKHNFFISNEKTICHKQYRNNVL